MERKVGEVFEFNGVKLKTLRDDVFSCKSCYFSRNMNLCDDMSCMWFERTDNKTVIFEEIKE